MMIRNRLCHAHGRARSCHAERQIVLSAEQRTALRKAATNKGSSVSTQMLIDVDAERADAAVALDKELIGAEICEMPGGYSGVNVKVKQQVREK